MTIINFKALIKTSTILVTIALLTLPTVTVSNAVGNGSDPAIVDSGHMLSVCFLDGGTVTTKANGDNHCKNPVTGKTTECSGPNGSPDACWTEGRPTGGRLTKPMLKSGTMIMQPHTNTTVYTRTKPTAGKSIMQKMIRN